MAVRPEMWRLVLLDAPALVGSDEPLTVCLCVTSLGAGLSRLA